MQGIEGRQNNGQWMYEISSDLIMVVVNWCYYKRRVVWTFRLVEVVNYDIDNGGGHMLLVSNCSMFTFGY